MKKLLIVFCLFLQLGFGQTVVSKKQNDLARMDWEYTDVGQTDFKLYKSFYSDTGPWTDTGIRINPKLRTYMFRVNFTTADKVYYCLTADDIKDPERESDKSNSVTVVRIP